MSTSVPAGPGGSWAIYSLKAPYLICLVVVLWVVLEHLLLLWVLPCRQVLVKSGLFPPLLAVDKPTTSQPRFPRRCALLSLLHLLAQVHIEFASSEKSQLAHSRLVSSDSTAFDIHGQSPCGRTHQSQGVEALGEALSFKYHAKLVDLGLLRSRQVAGVPILLDWSRCREVIAVVLGVKLESWGSHDC